MAKAVTISGDGYKSMRAGQSVIAFGKIAVEGSDDGIFSVRVIDMTCPLTYTGTAGICQHNTTDRVKGFQESVFFDGMPHLLGYRG